MRSARKAQRLWVGLLLPVLSVLLGAVLPGGEALWAQPKSLTVDGQGSSGR